MKLDLSVCPKLPCPTTWDVDNGTLAGVKIPTYTIPGKSRDISTVIDETADSMLVDTIFAETNSFQVVGRVVGAVVGLIPGFSVGLKDGDILNTTLGPSDGGTLENCIVGKKLGWRVGDNDGKGDGALDGISEGDIDGQIVGTIDGDVVLAMLGKKVGSGEG